jgi:Domain of unknown function (DUF4430)
LLVAAPVVAAAAPTVAKLRVEAEGRGLSPGVSYVNDTARLATRSNQCDGSGRSHTIAGPSAMGIVGYARQTHPRLSPFFGSDTFDFGLIVCRIGDSGAFSPSEAWLYKVNHVSPDVGGDQYRLRRGDEVLWYFADFATGKNTGDELELRAPARVRPNQPFTVTALAYDFAGNVSPAGARIGGDVQAVTSASGRTSVTAERAGSITLRAKRGRDVPSAPIRVCVNADLDRCPARRGEVIVGANAADAVGGTLGDDRVSVRAGADLVDVRGGGRDAVDCGAGADRVRADRIDRVGANCERRLG